MSSLWNSLLGRLRSSRAPSFLYPLLWWEVRDGEWNDDSKALSGVDGGGGGVDGGGGEEGGGSDFGLWKRSYTHPWWGFFFFLSHSRKCVDNSCLSGQMSPPAYCNSALLVQLAASTSIWKDSPPGSGSDPAWRLSAAVAVKTTILFSNRAGWLVRSTEERPEHYPWTKPGGRGRGGWGGGAAEQCWHHTLGVSPFPVSVAAILCH